MHALVLVLIAQSVEGRPADVVEVQKATVVFAKPRTDATKLGVIKKLARVEVKGTAEREGDECPRWIELAPRGWICESATRPTFESPTVAEPVVDDPAPIRATYGMVRRGTTAFASRDEITAGTGTALEGSNTVRARGTTTVEGTRYWITTNGQLIDASRIYQMSPSTFKGTAITGDTMPAWVRGRRDPYKPITTYAQPGGAKRGQLAARTPVTILEESGTFARVGDGEWVARQDLRVAAITEPPANTRADEKWFDVDLDTQILVAYEGARPVYATLVSTGKYGHFTPTLIARIASKHEATPMTSDKGDVYSVADVPWTMFYDGNYALHTSYWHDGFGGPRSHGCINLAPRDARALFAWSSPDVPAGWSSVYGSEEQPGSLVRIHAARLPAPKLRGYAKALAEGSVVANRY